MYQSCQTIKSDSHLPKEVGFVCFNGKSLNVIKNAFYFVSKALFIKIFKFLFRPF